ncbi:lytic transglycosylase domain-containing protein [Enterobacter quasiroggenkampii]|uniref:lytic transglycosylase domain-containing protein n=1 Tax=Enterobacter quasiroggenkampii TaxID=2497436 RepID=UPI0021CE8B9D|nr:transglycosylase SLT domain-containing protein [Enterobacter quasiroggenkampii]MCU6369964.1 transglycosylase SLT domain-containing protein [Enterobacter quasiroggenkampii]
MAGAQNSSIVDELFVSLGLKTDSESFRKGQNAVGELKSGFLQVAALTGTGLGFKAVTSDLAHTVQNMERLSRVTGFTVDKLRFLKHAFATAGLNSENASGFAQQLKNIDIAFKNQSLSTDAWSSGKFTPQEFSNRYTKNPYDATLYLIKSLNEESNEATRTKVLQSLGLSGNDYRTIIDNGIAGINKAQASWNKYGQGLPDGLDKDTEVFLERLGILQSQFSQLGESLGKDLIPPLNGFLKLINNFISANPEVVKILAYLAGAGGAAAGVGIAKKVLGGAGAAAGTSVVPAIAYGATAFYAYDKYDAIEQQATQADGTGSLWESIKARWNAGGHYNYNQSKGPMVEQRAQSGKRGAGGPQHAKFADLEQKYGLPSGLLNATYQKESGGGKYLFSKAGALGPFQFMPGTAKDLGLEGDDVFDLDLSAEAAAKYYQMLLRRYNGDVAKAAAAYNYGLGNIDRKGLSNLPAETRDYIPSILGGLDDPDYLADYNYRRNQPPVLGSSSTGGSITIQQTNHSTVHASGADADEVGRILQRQQTASLEQALAQTLTEKY